MSERTSRPKIPEISEIIYPSNPLESSKNCSKVQEASTTKLQIAVVKETARVVRNVDEHGNKMINNYVLLNELGRGVSGKVKLCRDSTGQKFAIKILDKNPRKRFLSKLSKAYQEGSGNSQLEKIKREIAIMKKCCHPHVVRLIEVVDDTRSDKIYLILEYLAGGELEWRTENKVGAYDPVHTESEVRSIFRDLVEGVQYLHHQGIVHRDIKPANMLWTSDIKSIRRIKITDFGVSVFVGRRKGKDELSKTAGSPAFFAPELCSIEGEERIFQSSSSLDRISMNKPKAMRLMLDSTFKTPPIGAGIDIWAMGVTLYCLIFGKVPFVGQSEYELFLVISSERLLYLIRLIMPSQPISEKLSDLFTMMLEKDTNIRLDMEKIKFNPWVLEDLTMEQKMSWLDENDCGHVNATAVNITSNDIQEALSLKQKVTNGLRKISSSIQQIASFQTSNASSQRTKKRLESYRPTSMPVVMGYLPLSLENKAGEIIASSPSKISLTSSTEIATESAKWMRWDSETLN